MSKEESLLSTYRDSDFMIHHVLLEGERIRSSMCLLVTVVNEELIVSLIVSNVFHVSVIIIEGSLKKGNSLERISDFTDKERHISGLQLSDNCVVVDVQV